MFTLSIPSVILVTCQRGLAPFVAAEMRELGFEVPEDNVMEAGVRTQGNLADCMLLNLHLRFAQRVHYRLNRFGAMHPDMVYRAVNAMPWEEIVAEDGYFSVHSSVSHPTITDGRFANLRVKDAVADRFMQVRGRRPDSGPDEERGLCLFLYWQGKKAELSLDCSGAPLSRRSYRLRPMAAPMQETLAAAVIRALDWDPDTSFVNPMCGSGTLAIEAALMAKRMAPGLLRDNFGFMHCLDFDAQAWQEMRAEAEARVLPRSVGRAPAIIATDIDPEAVDAARDNARRAGVEQDIEFKVCDFRDTPVPDGPGVVCMNPEYGQRLGNEDALAETYKAMGDFLKQRCAGKRAGVFTGNAALAKRVGLRAGRKEAFFNARIPCTLLVYDLWEGSR